MSHDAIGARNRTELVNGVAGTGAVELGAVTLGETFVGILLESPSFLMEAPLTGAIIRTYILGVLVGSSVSIVCSCGSKCYRDSWGLVLRPIRLGDESNSRY